MDLPGGISESETKSLRQLQRELSADGYRVVKTAIAAGGIPAALVYPGDDRPPLDHVISAARCILRLVETVPVKVSVTAEEYETLHALRVTASRLSRNAVVSQKEYSVGDIARIDLSRHVSRGSDLEE